jgi:hypothetical protein
MMSDVYTLTWCLNKKNKKEKAIEIAHLSVDVGGNDTCLFERLGGYGVPGHIASILIERIGLTDY